MIPAIKIQLNASDVNATKQEFQAVLNDLQRMSNGNPIKIDLNTVTTQITQMAEQLKSITSMTFNINTGELTSNLSKATNEIKNQTSQIQQSFDKIDFSRFTKQSYESIESLKKELNSIGIKDENIKTIVTQMGEAEAAIKRLSVEVNQSGIKNRFEFLQTGDNKYAYQDKQVTTDNSVAYEIQQQRKLAQEALKQQQEEEKAIQKTNAEREKALQYEQKIRQSLQAEEINKSIQEQNNLYSKTKSLIEEVYQAELKRDKNADSYQAEGLQNKIDNLNKQIESNYKLMDVEKQRQLISERDGKNQNLDIANKASLDKLSTELDYLSNKFKGVFPQEEVQSFKNKLDQLANSSTLSGEDIAKMDNELKILKNDLLETSRLQGLGNKVEGSSLNINSSIQDIEKYIRSLEGAKASVTNFGDIQEKNGQRFRVMNVEVDEGNNKISKHKFTLDEATASTYKMTTGVQDLSNRIHGFGDNIKHAFESVAGFSLVSGSIFGMVAEIKSGISVINELNKSQTNVEMITGMNSSAVQNLTKQYSELATQLHSTTTETMQGAEEFLRAGHNAENSGKLLQSATVGARIAGSDVKTMSDQLIAITNGFGMSAEKSMDVIDKLTTIDNNAATSTGELANALTRTSESAQLAGVSFEQISSWIATVSSVTRKSASSIGESFKTIFARLQDVKQGKSFDAEGESISNVEASLKKVGIQLRDGQDSFRSMNDVMNDVAKKWNTLNDLQQADIAKSIKNLASGFKTLLIAGKHLEPLVLN